MRYRNWSEMPLARRFGSGHAKPVARVVISLILVGCLAAVFIWQLLTPARASRAGTVPLRPAPDFSLTVWHGDSSQQVHLSALRGRTVVVNFWAPWCDPCKQEAPHLAQVARMFRTQPVVFVGVAFDSTRTDVVRFLAQYGIPYGSGIDTLTRIATAYHLAGIPTTVVIDPAGRILRTFVGPVSPSALEQSIHQAES